MIQQNSTDSSTEDETVYLYVWSPFYVNQLVERDVIVPAVEEQSNAVTVGYGTPLRIGATRVYVEQDADYDNTIVTSEAGNVLLRFAYDPFGAQSVLDVAANATANSIGWVVGFQGGFRDEVTGFVHFNARDLDPATGQWDEEDPAGGLYVNGPNLYQFDLSNSRHFVDPSGTSVISLSPWQLFVAETTQEIPGVDVAVDYTLAVGQLIQLDAAASAAHMSAAASKPSRTPKQSADQATAVAADKAAAKATASAGKGSSCPTKRKERTPAENRKTRNKFKNNKDAAKQAYTDRTGNPWPQTDGRDWPAHHPDSLKSGGDPMYVEPQDPDGVDPHNVVGPDGLTDYQRWGAQGTPARIANKLK